MAIFLKQLQTRGLALAKEGVIVDASFVGAPRPRNTRAQNAEIKEAGHDTLYSVRVGDHYRAIAHVEGSSVVWTWIGSHEEYNKLLRR